MNLSPGRDKSSSELLDALPGPQYKAVQERLMKSCSALLLAGAAVLLSGGAARSDDAGQGPVLLSTPVTHSDWMLHNPAPKWGSEGVHQILDRCRSCGLQRVYWRCFDGGRATYPSRLLEPLHGMDEDNYHRGRDSAWVIPALKQYDFGSFNALREAISYGHRIGLQVHAWLTINEDDHGWGITSRFARDHADSRWVARDGRVFRSQQSFAFPKVRAYKLALLKEVISYHPDGIFFDWIRTGDTRDNPQTDADGVALHGYEAPNVAAFRKAYGVDPQSVPNADLRWVRVRAEPQTIFMREAAGLIRKTDARMPITVLVQHPWGYRGAPTDTPYKDSLSGLLLDVGQWAAEGLIDTVIAAGYYRPGGSPENAFRWLERVAAPTAQTVTGPAGRDHCTSHHVVVGLYGWITTPDGFHADLRRARELGAHELLLWESDYLELPPARAELAETMARRAPQSAPAQPPPGSPISR